ncbi:MAG: TetR/AcrR family transcriptional regulator [Aliidongia sp.]
MRGPRRPADTGARETQAEEAMTRRHPPRIGDPAAAPKDLPAKPGRDRTVENQKRIEAAALALFTTQGYHGTNNREIADRAGVSTSAIYLHYSSKEAIFVDLAQKCRSQMTAWFEGAVTGLKDPFFQRGFAQLRLADLVETGRGARSATARADRRDRVQEPAFRRVLPRHARSAAAIARTGVRRGDAAGGLARTRPRLRAGRRLQLLLPLRLAGKLHAGRAPFGRFERAGDRGASSICSAADCCRDRRSSRASRRAAPRRGDGWTRPRANGSN